MSLLILTTQHEPTICIINTLKQILEMKKSISLPQYKHEYRNRL